MTARHPDEALTLAGAFIHAGAATAIGALWSVNDLSTALLMSRFYELADTGRGGLPPWTALRKAQLWLRDAEPAALARPLRYMMESNPALPSTEKNNSREARGGHFADPYWWSPFLCTGAPQSAISPEPDQ
jgi:CHAT domain-containing protein